MKENRKQAFGGWKNSRDSVNDQLKEDQRRSQVICEYCDH